MIKFNGIEVRLPSGVRVGVLQDMRISRSNSLQKVYNIIYRGGNMDKYSVKIDKKKVDQQKKKEPGEKVAGLDDPTVNVPIDPDRGTEPFEERPDDG